MNIFSSIRSFNADRYTPIGLYLGLRYQYRNPCLLESNDYHDRSDSTSVIGLDPIVEIRLENGSFTVHYADRPDADEVLTFEKQDIDTVISGILKSFRFSSGEKFNGFYGRIGFEFSHITESRISAKHRTHELPDLHLYVFRYLIVIDHFKDEGRIIKNDLFQNDLTTEEADHLLSSKAITEFPFELEGEETSAMTSEEFLSLVQKAREHCQRGDVFQLVVSNSYTQPYFGDDFNVYRELRRLNPSPYLFYFDFENYRLFGSSPEAQLLIRNNKAEIHPIAGTIKKSGIPEKDMVNIARLRSDEKENSEHVMLVDLARNDLSRSCANVRIESYREIQQFSHVFHIVSKVTGQLKGDPMSLFNATFPAGTLSGAPKPMALELISKYEPDAREFYGGAIGFIEPRGDLNMAIVIRSILARENQMHYRAGAGIVLESIPENESLEIENKLNAVRKAIALANEKSIIPVS